MSHSAVTTSSSVTMPADSTQDVSASLRKHRKYSSNIKEKKKQQKKKDSRRKRYSRRSSGQESSDDCSEHESDLDLSRDLHPIGHYIRDRHVMMTQMMRSISGKKLHAMLPDILKPLDTDELKRLCVEQLMMMSKKRVRRLLEGDEADQISSTGSEDSSSGDDDDEDNTVKVEEGVTESADDNKPTNTQNTAAVDTVADAAEAEPSADSKSDTTEHQGKHYEKEEAVALSSNVSPSCSRHGDEYLPNDAEFNDELHQSAEEISNKDGYSEAAAESHVENDWSDGHQYTQAAPMKKLRKKVKPVIDDMEEGEVVDSDTEYETDTDDDSEEYEEKVSDSHEDEPNDECIDEDRPCLPETSPDNNKVLETEKVSDVDLVVKEADNAETSGKAASNAADADDDPSIECERRIKSDDCQETLTVAIATEDDDDGFEMHCKSSAEKDASEDNIAESADDTADYDEVDIELSAPDNVDSIEDSEVMESEVSECSKPDLPSSVVTSSSDNDEDDNVTVTIDCKEFDMSMLKQRERRLARFANTEDVSCKSSADLQQVSQELSDTSEEGQMSPHSTAMMVTDETMTKDDASSSRTVVLKPSQTEPPKTLSGRRIVLKRKPDHQKLGSESIAPKRKSLPEVVAEQVLIENRVSQNLSASGQKTITLPDSSVVSNLKVKTVFTEPIASAASSKVSPRAVKKNSPVKPPVKTLSPVGQTSSKRTVVGKKASGAVAGHAEASSELSPPPSINPPRVELALTQTHMEIMELEMRARAIKAMLKAQEEFEKHSNKAPAPNQTPSSEVSKDAGAEAVPGDNGDASAVSERRVVKVRSSVTQAAPKTSTPPSTDVQAEPKQNAKDIGSRLLSLSNTSSRDGSHGSYEKASKRCGGDAQVSPDSKFKFKMRSDWSDPEEAYTYHSKKPKQSDTDSARQSTIKATTSSGRNDRKTGNRSSRGYQSTRSQAEGSSSHTVPERKHTVTDDSDTVSSSEGELTISRPLEDQHRASRPGFTPRRGFSRGRFLSQRRGLQNRGRTLGSRSSYHRNTRAVPRRPVTQGTRGRRDDSTRRRDDSHGRRSSTQTRR